MLFGFAEAENLFVTDDGWDARYVPLTILRQPFLIGFQESFEAGVPQRTPVVHVDLVWLALVAVFFSVIGAFYYIRIVKLMYFDASETEEPLAVSTDMQIAVSLNGLAVLALGLFPGGLLAVCAAVLA